MATSFDSVARHRRSAGTLLRALFERRHYVAAANAFARVDAPVDFLKRYISNGGSYPAQIAVKTPLGPISLTTYSPDDVQTINEIFLRGDYDVVSDGAVVVDFGSNIGISAAFFLTRRPDAFVYCHEPVPRNIERLKLNLAQFAGRFELRELAVGTENGPVRFGCEPTGRYGGVGRETGQWIEVPCQDSNEILTDIIARHGRINTLKIDIETLEAVVTERIPPELSSKIDSIVVEYPFATNPLAATHAMERRHFVTMFRPL
jgi:FkbM family methyltransferase